MCQRPTVPASSLRVRIPSCLLCAFSLMAPLSPTHPLTRKSVSRVRGVSCIVSPALLRCSLFSSCVSIRGSGAWVYRGGVVSWAPSAHLIRSLRLPPAAWMPTTPPCEGKECPLRRCPVVDDIVHLFRAPLRYSCAFFAPSLQIKSKRSRSKDERKQVTQMGRSGRKRRRGGGVCRSYLLRISMSRTRAHQILQNRHTQEHQSREYHG